MALALLVALGGAVGSLCRYLVMEATLQATRGNPFPYGTLIVNVVGCAVIGLLHGVAESRGIPTPYMRAVAVIGFLGGFTTFSSFGLDTLTLARNGDFSAALLNIVIQFILGLGAAGAGYYLARALTSS